MPAGLPNDDKDDADSSSSSEETEPRRRSLFSEGESSDGSRTHFFFERDGVVSPPEEQPLIEHKSARDANGDAILLGTVEDPFIDPSSADWNSLPWWNETSTDQVVEDDRRAGHGVNAWGNFRRPMKRDGQDYVDQVEEDSRELDKRAGKPPPAAVTASRAAKSGADKGPQVGATQKPSPTKGKPSCTPSSTYVAPTASELAMRNIAQMR